MRKHYLSPRVIFCLVTGRFVPPIHRRNLYSMQYAMLPTRRAGLREVWSRIMMKDLDNAGKGIKSVYRGKGARVR